MKFRKKLIPLIIIFVFFGIYFFTGLDRILIDGIHGDIGSLIVRTDTKYSKAYTHSKFNQIEIGMSEEELISILGDPLYFWEPYKSSKHTEKEHYIGYVYSESPSSSSYRLRHVYLDGKVVAEINGYFYVD